MVILDKNSQLYNIIVKEGIDKNHNKILKEFIKICNGVTDE